MHKNLHFDYAFVLPQEAHFATMALHAPKRWRPGPLGALARCGGVGQPDIHLHPSVGPNRTVAGDRILGSDFAGRRRMAALGRPSDAGSFRLTTGRKLRRPGAWHRHRRRNPLWFGRLKRRCRSDQQGLASGPVGPTGGSGSCGIPRVARGVPPRSSNGSFAADSLQSGGMVRSATRKRDSHRPVRLPPLLSKAHRGSRIRVDQTSPVRSPEMTGEEIACGRAPESLGHASFFPGPFSGSPGPVWPEEKLNEP
jgi:hypothetical protein